MGADRRWPLVVAANRDERLGRPSESWALRELGGGSCAVAPRDVEHGGTWIGVADGGLFAAITNYYSPEGRFPDRGRRTRGELVSAALTARSTEAARAAVRALDPHRYNPFHLVVATGAGGFLWRYDGRRAEMDEVGPGLHVVSERDPHGRGPRAEYVRAHWPVDLSPGKLRQLLAGHGRPEQDFPCVHLGTEYGTRSSAVLRLASSLDHSELYVADGSPCVAPFDDRSRLLAELAARFRAPSP